MNSLCGEMIRKDVQCLEESYGGKSEYWMQTEYDERVIDYPKITYGNKIVEMENDDRLQDAVKKVDTMPLPLGALVLSNGKHFMNKFIHAIDGFYTNNVYYTDTDRLYIKNKHWDKLDKARFVG